MMAVILAGGLGTRLKPFTFAIPKPLLPLGNVHILEVVIRQLAAAGFKRVVLTLGYMAPVFPALLGDGGKWGINIEYRHEDEPLGTAGSLRLVDDLEDDFLVMNGDILTTIDYRALMKAHKAAAAWGTIAVTRREAKIDYGVVDIDGQGLLEGFKEKPVLHYEVSMGINILSKQAMRLIPATGRFDMPDLMLAIKGSGKKVLCYRTDCYWQDIGRFEDYQKASDDFTAEPGRFFASSSG